MFSKPKGRRGAHRWAAGVDGAQCLVRCSSMPWRVSKWIRRRREAIVVGLRQLERRRRRRSVSVLMRRMAHSSGDGAISGEGERRGGAARGRVA
jgi:hypothetical protein